MQFNCYTVHKLKGRLLELNQSDTLHLKNMNCRFIFPCVEVLYLTNIWTSMQINSESDWEGKGSSMELSQKKTGDWYNCLTLLDFGFSLLQVFAF